MSHPQPHLFCFGLGYCGMVLARSLRAQGWEVSGTVRDETQVASVREEGINAIIFEDSLILPSGTTHILSTVPPDEHGDPVCNLLQSCEGITWMGYLSTTGVYGDTGGEVVDETDPVNPTTERGRRRVDAEQQWMALNMDLSLPVHIFRLPGIYGPGRSAFEHYRENRLRHIGKPGHLFNRIHVDDIAQVLQASMEQPNPGSFYNVCDDLPAEPADITTYACELMGVEPPPLVAFDVAAKTISPMVLSFWHDNRRVSNARIKSELGINLKYPDYREGLKAIWEAMP